MDIDILKKPEGKSLEFKRDLSSPERVLRTIVAFANTAGGTLIIGVEDATKRVLGLDDPLEVEERIANLISDRVVPRLIPDLDILSWRQTNLLAVRVYPSPRRPHYLKRAGLEAGVYVRVGSTNRRADRELIEELQRFSRGQAYDEQAMTELRPEALDFLTISNSFAQVRRIKRADLETLRLLTPHQGRKVPTIGGELLFGKDRERYFPDAWIQAGRFQGRDKTHISDRIDIRLYPVQAIEEAIVFVQKHALRGAEIGEVRRRDIWSLPPVAVREAIINAVAHADYSQLGGPIRVSIFDDRLEVENPGLLPFGLTIDDLKAGISKIRNRVIARVFHELGLIEQWGSGIQRMISVCRDSGMAMPLFEEMGNRFRVTLFTKRTGKPELDTTDQAILDSLSRGKGLSTSEIASAIDRTPRTTRTRLVKLIERGLVSSVGTRPQDPKRRYYLST